LGLIRKSINRYCDYKEDSWIEEVFWRKGNQLNRDFDRYKFFLGQNLSKLVKHALRRKGLIENVYNNIRILNDSIINCEKRKKDISATVYSNIQIKQQFINEQNDKINESIIKIESKKKRLKRYADRLDEISYMIYTFKQIIKSF